MLAVSKVTNVRRADMRSSQSLAEEYYECHTNNFFSKGTMDSAWTDREVHCLIDIWTDEEIQSLLESANETDLFSKESLARKYGVPFVQKRGSQCTSKSTIFIIYP